MTEQKMIIDQITSMQLKESDVIILTLDAEALNLDSCEKVYKEGQEAFPNNEVLCKFKPYMDVFVVRDVE